MTAQLIAPVEVSAIVPLSQERAFTLFTTDFASWWPLSTHSLGQDDAVGGGVEPHAGGDIYEVQSDGTRVSWGHVIAWEPPSRVVYAWHPGHEPHEAQQVEVQFTAVPDGTRVELRHYGWEALGEKAEATRAGYSNGWLRVFGESFVNAARAEGSRD
jgi:uncharacterized protein YndB with AHSA1/START domain